MIDAIGTLLHGGAAQRAEPEQPALRSAGDDADPFTRDKAETAKFYSPVVRLDSEAQRVVLQYRDTSTGEVVVQYPSEKQLEAYRKRASSDEEKPQQADDQDAKVDAAGIRGVGKDSAVAPDVKNRESKVIAAVGQQTVSTIPAVGGETSPADSKPRSSTVTA